MHPDRLSFLATEHWQRKAIVSRMRDTNGHWKFKLECGHDGSCVGHFDCSKTTHWNCIPCGLEYVKSAPQYAKEFK